MKDLDFRTMFPELNDNQIIMFKRYMAKLIDERIDAADTEDARYNLEVLKGTVEEL